LRSCSRSFIVVLVVVGVRGTGAQHEVVAGDLAEHQSLEPVEIVEAVVLGGADRGAKRGARVLPHQGEQSAQARDATAGEVSLQAGHVVFQLGRGAVELLLLGKRPVLGPALATGRAVRGEGDARVDRLEDPPVRGNPARAVVDVDAILGLAHLHAVADEGVGR
jgi:hypothetical protein